MVAILVFLTFVAFAAAAWVFASKREPAAEGLFAGEALRAPPTTASWLGSGAASYLHPSHVWVRLEPNGIATVGSSAFAENFVGAESRVDAADEGSVLRQGEPAWTLVSRKNRRLVQAMPLDGTIVAVNRARADRRGGAPWEHKGDWILKIRPMRLAENLQNLIRGSLYEAWQEAAGLRLNATLAPAIGRVANDGGVWLENFGDLIGDDEWLELREHLFPAQPGVIVHGASGR